MPPYPDSALSAPRHIGRRRLIGLAAGALAFPSLAQTRTVTVGYQDLLVPMKLIMESTELERNTGYRIVWKMYDTGADIMKAMAAGDIQIGEVGSSPLTAAATAGQGVRLLWICDDMANAEALVVRENAGIARVSDLRGKTLATPHLSTSHYQLYAALTEAGVVRSVKLLALKPPQIRAAWDAGIIDGAYVWNPVLGHLKNSGKVLLSAAQVAQRGYPTFDGLAGNGAWAEANEGFVVALIQAIARAQRSLRRDAGQLDTANAGGTDHRAPDQDPACRGPGWHGPVPLRAARRTAGHALAGRRCRDGHGQHRPVSGDHAGEWRTAAQLRWLHGPRPLAQGHDRGGALGADLVPG